jgi:hypothetical protein
LRYSRCIEIGLTGIASFRIIGGFAACSPRYWFTCCVIADA